MKLEGNISTAKEKESTWSLQHDLFNNKLGIQMKTGPRCRNWSFPRKLIDPCRAVVGQVADPQNY